jgi:hypothetical protein
MTASFASGGLGSERPVAESDGNNRGVRQDIAPKNWRIKIHTALRFGRTSLILFNGVGDLCAERGTASFSLNAH